MITARFPSISTTYRRERCPQYLLFRAKVLNVRKFLSQNRRNDELEGSHSEASIQCLWGNEAEPWIKDYMRKRLGWLVNDSVQRGYYGENGELSFKPDGCCILPKYIYYPSYDTAYLMSEHILEIKTFTYLILPQMPLYSHLAACALYIEYYKKSVILIYFNSMCLQVWLLTNDNLTHNLCQFLPSNVPVYFTQYIVFDKDYTREYFNSSFNDRTLHIKSYIKYIFKIAEYSINEVMFNY